jgi:hypothetical protein
MRLPDLFASKRAYRHPCRSFVLHCSTSKQAKTAKFTGAEAEKRAHGECNRNEAAKDTKQRWRCGLKVHTSEDAVLIPGSRDRIINSRAGQEDGEGVLIFPRRSSFPMGSRVRVPTIGRLSHGVKNSLAFKLSFPSLMQLKLSLACCLTSSVA